MNDNGEYILEDGDHFEVRWQTIHRSHSSYPPLFRSFVFQKEKDEFVTKLLTDKDVTDICVGTFNKIK